MRLPFLIGAIGLSGVVLAGLSPSYNTGDRAPHSHHSQGEAARHKPVGSDYGDGKAMGHSAHSHAGHDHSKLVSFPLGTDAPTLDFELAKDSASGWNLHITTTNFRFAPENVNASNRIGEGHAHIYVNGNKLARVYGPWYHIGALPRGEVVLQVTLNANDHRTLAVGEAALSVTKTISVD